MTKPYPHLYEDLKNAEKDGTLLHRAVDMLEQLWLKDDYILQINQQISALSNELAKITAESSCKEENIKNFEKMKG